MSRRTQIGLVSFSLTLLWATGLFAAFVGGKIGQHPSVPTALAAAGAFCAAISGLLLTLACFPALAFAAPHSVYFLLFPGHTFVQWTGIVATGLLIPLGLLGLITSYNTFWRLWTHRVIAILMVIATALHWFQFLPAATVLFIGLCVAGVLNLKLVSQLSRLNRGSVVVRQARQHA